MSEKYLSHSQKFITAVDEMDYREIPKPSAVLQYFQDLATSHANLLGIGYIDMLRRGELWVLSRLSYRVCEYPKIGDEITVTTYPKKPRIVDVNRDYYVTGNDGKVLISGTSKWCVIGKDDRAIKKCRDLFAFDDSVFRPDDPFEGGNIGIKSLDKLGAKVVPCGEFCVHITDLDRNFHMNNARYGDIVLNSCNVEELNNKIIKSFDINFISELRLNEKITVSRVDIGGETYFDAVKDDGTVVFRARVGWEPFANERIRVEAAKA